MSTITLSHSNARDCCVRACQALLSDKDAWVAADATARRHAVQLLQAVGWCEGQYGAGWKGAGVGSNNWGAVQAGSGWGGKTFVYTDTHPNDDGSSTPYQVKFRYYDSAQAGADDLCRQVFLSSRDKGDGVLKAALAGDIAAFSAAMHARGYYEGFGRTVTDRINNHAKWITGGLRTIALSLCEPMPGDSAPPMPTLKRGSNGEAVATLQRILKLVPDGQFGKVTEDAVRAFQEGRGLKDDGVVGPATWDELNVEATFEPEFDDPGVADTEPPPAEVEWFAVRKADLVRLTGFGS